ncbi:MAG: sigma-70 family RNA polymerase sigma factor [Ottowia sp.]|nr:sigma-70 family RNA polymerase sigma factor [Ottowia sp.]
MPASPTAAPNVALLYQEHHGWITGWLRRKLDDGAQAQDLAHDTFMQLLSARQLPPLDEPRAYLLTVARRTLFSFWRRREIEQAYIDALARQPLDFQPSEQDRYAILQALEAVDRALDGLPPASRHVLLLSQLHGLTYAQIGPRLGLAEVTVRRHMARAIAACCALDADLR